MSFVNSFQNHPSLGKEASKDRKSEMKNILLDIVNLRLTGSDCCAHYISSPKGYF